MKRLDGVETASIGDLREFAFFAGLSDRELDGLVTITEARQLAEGETLFRPGDAADGIWLLSSGCVRMSLRVGATAQVVVSTIRAGQSFGWRSVVGPHAQGAEASVIEDGAALLVPAEGLRSLMSRNLILSNHVMTKVAHLAAQRLSESRSQLISWMDDFSLLSS